MDRAKNISSIYSKVIDTFLNFTLDILSRSTC